MDVMPSGDPGPAGVRSRLAAWAPALLYAGLIFWQSAQPLPPSVPAWPGADKVAHVLGYALLGLLVCRAMTVSAPGRSRRLLAGASFLMAALYGISDELHQHIAALRQADALDALADAVGSACGVWVYLRLRRPKPRAATPIDKPQRIR